MNSGFTLAERLQSVILQKHISYLELEKLSGVPKSAIQRYATGKTKKVPMDRLFRIANALDVTPWDLIDYNYDVEPGKYLAPEWEKWQAANSSRSSSSSISTPADPSEQELVDIYRDLNPLGQNTLLGTARGLSANPDMRKDGTSTTETA